MENLVPCSIPIIKVLCISVPIFGGFISHSQWSALILVCDACEYTNELSYTCSKEENKMEDCLQITIQLNNHVELTENWNAFTSAFQTEFFKNTSSIKCLLRTTKHQSCFLKTEYQDIKAHFRLKWHYSQMSLQEEIIKKWWWK